jgi:class 3 adenylate cyclase/pimeloyl-ACP methyl ester carboxylesterase
MRAFQVRVGAIDAPHRASWLQPMEPRFHQAGRGSSPCCPVSSVEIHLSNGPERARDWLAMGRTQAVTILFCDLVASTERRARLGDDAFDEFTTRFMATLRRTVAANDGRVVSSAGDGLMVVFPRSIADAVVCATTMHRSVAELDPHDPPLLRIGISSGEVAQDGDEYSGMPIVEAARLEAAAQPGKTLANAVVRSLLGTRRAFRFRDVGRLTLKGLPAPLATVEVLDDEDAEVRSPTSVTPASRRRYRWPIVLGIGTAALAIAVVAFIVSGGSGSGDTAASAGLAPAKGYTPRFVSKPCAKDFLNQVPDGTCGELVVPEDRAKPNGRMLRLPVTRAPARSGSGASDPVIAIGGIDGKGAEDPAKTPARDHAELIDFPTRLNEVSDPSMACPDFEPIGHELLTRSQRDPATIARGQHALRACYQKLTAAGVALSRYTLEDAAEDVLDLMRALHFRRVNLTAIGDSTISAYAIVREAPGAVRTLTLDGPVAPGTSSFTDPTAQLGSAFDQYLQLCKDNANCAQAYPDLATRGHNNWQRFSASPVTVNATQTDGPQLPVLVDGDRSGKAVADALGDTRNEGTIAAGIANPPPDILGSLALDYDYYFGQPGYPWARTLSAWCSYDRYTISPASTISSRTRPDLAGVDDGSLQWECAAWPVPKVSPRAFASMATDIPTMIADGELDPFTSRQWASTLQGGLANATVLLFPTQGARLLLWGPPCLNDLRRRFLADPTKHLAGESCTNQSPAINFVTSSP